MEEIWKDIEGYEDIYKVNIKGEVHSKKKGRLLTPCKDTKGYHYYSLYNNGQRKNHRQHRLIAKYFMNCYFDKCDVNHKNGNRLDNFIDNLECVSHRENISHGFNMLKKTSKYSNVSANGSRWSAYIKYQGKPNHLGIFDTEEEAYEQVVAFRLQNGITNKYELK